jgi:hypothetical protein
VERSAAITLRAQGWETSAGPHPVFPSNFRVPDVLLTTYQSAPRRIDPALPSRLQFNAGLLMSRIIAFLLFCLLTAAPAVAQVNGAFSVLRMDASPRAAALGGAFSPGTSPDAQALFYNPAWLSEETSGRLSLAYLNHIGDLNAGFTAYARDIIGIGTVAAGLRFFSWGSTERIDEFGVDDGSFGASDVALTVGIGREYAEGVRIGAAVHAVTSGIDNHRGTAFAADLGVTYLIPRTGLAASASVHNLGIVTSSLGQTDDALPTDFRVSITGRLRHLPLQLTLAGRNLHEPGGNGEFDGLDAVMRHVSLGGEFLFSDSFQLRFGYNHQRHQDLKMSSRLDLAGLGLGFGLQVNRFMLDYGFNSWSSLGGLHYLGVSTRI